MIGRSVIVTCVVVLVASGLTVAQDGDYLRVEFSDSANVGTFVVDLADAWWEVPAQRLVWQLSGGPTQILDDITGARVATLVSCDMAIQFSPNAAVEMSITVLAADEMVGVRLQSPVLSFPTVSAGDAFGRALISFDLLDGPDGFAEMTSLATPVGTGAFRARYNGAGESGQTFAHMIWQISIEGDPGQSAGSINVNQSMPVFGYGPIGTDVSDMSVDISYVVTPGDAVIAVSNFELDRPVEGWSCAGDIDLNGVIDLGDLGLMLISFGDCGSSSADMNGDQCVNVTDLGMLLAVFGTGC